MLFNSLRYVRKEPVMGSLSLPDCELSGFQEKIINVHFKNTKMGNVSTTLCTHISILQSGI